jgi:hypothetical protein
MNKFRWTSASRWLLILLVLPIHACGGASIVLPGPDTPDPGSEEARGVPGFDTRDYPGDAVMEAWLDASPYRWVGYYLPAPCYTGTSWAGKRARLETMGWGTAVLFVGEQDWPVSHPSARAGLVADSTAERCTRDNLSGDRGREDGAAAAAAARAEGFRAGTVIYLDVERVDTVSTPLADYVAGWTTALLAAGYGPGLYAHARNAEDLMAVMGDAAGGRAAPRLWVARPGGFSLRRGPTESGYPAEIWQGELDVEDSWAGTTLRIDRNVAAGPDPSG